MQEKVQRRESRDNRKRGNAHFAHERLAVEVAHEHVHVKAAIVRRIAASGLLSWDARVDNEHVMHVGRVQEANHVGQVRERLWVVRPVQVVAHVVDVGPLRVLQSIYYNKYD